MRQALCPVLVGRDFESRCLSTVLDKAGAGAGGVVLLAGEAGIGKSRLARLAAEEARRKGRAVLTGRAVAGGVPTPFRPFAEALASALRPGGLPDSADLDPFLPALGRLVPQVRPGPAVEADRSLVFLGEAVLRLLRVLSPGEGCLLVLEDLHWADPETLALVEYLADNVWSEQVVCVGTFRPEEGDAANLAAKLESRGSAEVLPLARLDRDAVEVMARACLGAAELPATVGRFVADRGEGIPFLVEEVLAGLLEDGVLLERDGRWETTGPVEAGVPATFSGAVIRRLEAAAPGSRLVIHAAAVLGRMFDWSLLGAMTGLPDAAVTAALREGVGLQLITAGRGAFTFRHALTHEAVLDSLLPPERARLAGRALEVVTAAQPGLPGAWCTLAADLAERSGDTVRAAELLLEAGRRDLAVGALATAEETLTRARMLAADAGEAVLQNGVDEALTEVFAMSGQVDRAIEGGQRLLARIGTSSAARSADLHLLIARAAMAGGRWDEAAASVRIAGELSSPGTARVGVCAARVALGLEDLAEARRLAKAALQAAEDAELPEVQCEALEVIGRVARQHDREQAESYLARAASIASAHGLRLAEANARAELASVNLLRKENLDELTRARGLAEEAGALFTAAALDLQIASMLIKEFRADEALEVASRCAGASRRFHLLTLGEALQFEAAAHAIRGEREQMEARIAEAIEAAPDDRANVGCTWGRCRAMLSILQEDLGQAWTELSTGAPLVLTTPAGPAPPFLGLWPLIGAALGRDADTAAARVRAAHSTRNQLIADLLGYTDAILAGRDGQPAAAEAAFADADARIGPRSAWYQHYARRIAAEAALADGWGDPVPWLRDSAAYFEARRDDRIAGACRALLRRAGAPVPRRRAGDAELPGQLRALGVTGREADVLGLVAAGLTNREIAERMFLSPRTVEKHVASLLVKTGLRRRAQLAGYLGDVAG